MFKMNRAGSKIWVSEEL